MSFVAHRYGLSPSLLFRWKRRMLEGRHRAVQADEDVVGTSRVRELERRVHSQTARPPREREAGNVLRAWHEQADLLGLSILALLDPAYCVHATVVAVAGRKA